MKKCIKCLVEKPATKEYFHKASQNKDGLKGTCKDCCKERDGEYRKNNKKKLSANQQEYYKKNKEYFSKKSKEYRENNKEALIKYAKEYYRNNKEKINVKKKIYHEKNKEYFRQLSKEYYLRNRESFIERASFNAKKNPEKVKGYKRKWRVQNRDLAKKYSQTYRAIKLGLPCTLEREEWSKIKKDFNYSCCYCGISEKEHQELYGEQLHQEHFIPVTKGGEYTHNNILPCCRKCNSSKSNKDFFEWYPNQEIYSSIREVFILDYLGYKGNVQQLSIL